MGNFYEERRKMRFEQVERMLNSDITVAEWCALNKVAESTMYHWLKVYRESNGSDSSKRNGWIEIERKEMRGDKALAVANASATASSDAILDAATSQLYAQPIRIRANGVEIDVFANTAPADIKAVLEALVTL